MKDHSVFFLRLCEYHSYMSRVWYTIKSQTHIPTFDIEGLFIPTRKKSNLRGSSSNLIRKLLYTGVRKPKYTRIYTIDILRIGPMNLNDSINIFSFFSLHGLIFKHTKIPFRMIIFFFFLLWWIKLYWDIYLFSILP